MHSNERSQYKIGELFDISSGLSKNRKDFGFGFPFLTFKEVFDNYFLPNELVNLANSTEIERENCSIKKGDIFITRTSETLDELGMSSVALQDYETATFNGFTKRLRLKENVDIKLNLEFMGYYLRGPKFRNQIRSLASLTTRASLNNSMLNNIEIDLPPYKEQAEIGRLLKALDEKIETNNKINKKLEEVAMTIFKHWIVDFDYPNVDGEPFNSSGGDMFESDMGLIPNGWSICNIGDYAKVKSGYAFKSAWWKDEGVPVVKIKSLYNNSINFNDVGYVEEDKIEKAQEFLVKAGDLLIAMTGATIGKIGLVPNFPGPVLVNQRVGKFFLGENPLDKVGFLYCLINQNYVREQIISRGSGSAQANISPSQIESIKIVLPPENIVNKINNVLKDKFALIAQNIRENRVLSEMRDYLLPKLLSGEITVLLEK